MPTTLSLLLSWRPVVLLAAALTCASGCRTAKSHLESAQTDAIVARRPGGLVGRAVAPENIQSLVPPATAADGLPATMHGIWWRTDRYDGEPSVVSFANAYWDIPTATASLAEGMPGAESFADGAGSGTGDADAEAKDQDKLYFNRQDFTFSADGKVARIYRRYGQTEPNSRDEPERLLALVEDGYWKLYNGEDEDLGFAVGEWRRIVNADGTRAAAFDDYVRSFSKPLLVMYPALTLDLGDEEISLNLEPGRGQYIAVSGSDQANLGAYVVTAEANGPLLMHSRPQRDAVSTSTIDGKQLTIVTSNTQKAALYIRSEQGGPVRLRVQDTRSVTISDINQPAKIKLTPGRQTRIALKVPPARAGIVEMSVTAGGPAVLFSDRAGKFYEGKFLTRASAAGTTVLAHPKDGATEATVVFKAIPTDITLQKPLSITNREVKQRLASVASGHVYPTRSAPAPVGSWKTFAFNGSQAGCCFGLAEMDAQADGATMLKKVQAAPPSLRTRRDSRVLVFYGGDLNDPSPKLDYQLAADYELDSETNKLCRGNGGRGFGPPIPCEGLTCALDTDGEPKSQCVVGTPPCANNDGKGFGTPYTCGDLQCAKDDGKTFAQDSVCIVRE